MLQVPCQLAKLLSIYHNWTFSCNLSGLKLGLFYFAIAYVNIPIYSDIQDIRCLLPFVTNYLQYATFWNS